MDFYVLSGHAAIAEYVIPGPDIDPLKQACRKSAFQLLDHEPMTVEISQDGGTEFPDFILCHGVIPLVSENLRQAFLDLRLDNLFYKPVDLACAELELHERYWLALPPRIDCLDWRACAIEEDTDPTCGFWARFHRARNLVIDEAKIGNYRIFKLPANMLNQEIIVTREVKNSLAAKNFRNLHFYSTNREEA